MATWTTQEIFAEVVRRCSSGERVALCTVVATRGSCPQSAGAKMIVLGDGRTLGTLGGGCVEAEVRTRATALLLEDRSDLLSFTLDHDYGWDDGLICGGVMDIFVQSLDGSRMQQMTDALAAIGRAEPAEIRIPYTRQSKEQRSESCEYVERIDPPPALLIVGGGHVAHALAQLAPNLGFEVDILDDRADYVTESRFPLARKLIVGEIENELARYPIDANTFIVIVTRGHQHDGRALAAVIDSPARYIGMIGSKRKIKAIFDDLHADGTSIETLSRVRAPIGLDIGAVTVQEIAVSIAAELIAIKRGQGEKPARAMKIDEAQLRAWIERPAHTSSSTADERG